MGIIAVNIKDDDGPDGSERTLRFKCSKTEGVYDYLTSGEIDTIIEILKKAQKIMTGTPVEPEGTGVA